MNKKVCKTHATNEGYSKVSMKQDKVVKYILVAMRYYLIEINLKTKTSYI